MRWKRTAFFAVGLFLSTCAKDAGEINVTLDVTSSLTLTDADRANIHNFIFIVSYGDPALGTDKILYPADCTGCTDCGTSCSPRNCLKPSNQCDVFLAAGEAREDSFRPKISFSDFSEGSQISVIACAMKDNQTVAAGGIPSGSFKNTKGTAVTITLTNPSTECNENIPAPCPPCS